MFFIEPEVPVANSDRAALPFPDPKIHAMKRMDTALSISMEYSEILKAFA